MKPCWLSLLAGTAAALMAVETLFYLPVLASTASPLSFNRDVRPILSNHCFSCHGSDVQQRKAQRRLDTFDGAVALRDGIQGIAPGKPAQSELWRRVTSSDPEEVMPPAKSAKRLSEAEKRTLRAWIENGAQYEAHWSFEPPRSTPPPRTIDGSWPRNPIDAFVLDRLEKEGLKPAPGAPPEILLRRASLDLTGLPPSEALLCRFSSNPDDQEYLRAVDELMASYAYAERQAQDWLDLARYADSNGFSDDQTRTIWPYRDWVIKAIAQNMPFDQFTIEQLAGDLLPEATPEQTIASAFHRNAPQAKGNTYPVEEYRIKGVIDRVNTTGTAWLGLTLGCAECHDHKFDPISQREYFSLFAIFNNVVHSGEAFAQDGPFFDTPLPADMAGKSPANRTVRKIPVMAEQATPRETRVHVRGNFLRKGEIVLPGVPAVFGTDPGTHPTNRLQLARWLVDGKNPLTARVAVNRLWQSSFGQGLVRTPADFGKQGASPSHPELLDWLARELVSSGWNLRLIHRWIVTSSTYRQAAHNPGDPARLLDPQNLLLARAPRPRLGAEQIRDQALATAGLLTLAYGGEPVFPHQPEHYWEERALPGKWAPSLGADRYRRSLYTYWRRMALHPTLELLDAPARTVCTAKRTVSNVPTQALVTLNDPIFTEAAEAFAQRILHEAPATDTIRLEHGFQLALARKPSPEERMRFLEFLALQHARGLDDAAAWTRAAAVLLNLDEFLCRP